MLLGMRARDPFLGVAPDEIARRVYEAATVVTVAPVAVRVGEEGCGFRNIGVDLPAARRSRLESRNLAINVRRALEAIGVTMYYAAVAPRVWADLEGSVRVRDVPLGNAIDAGHLAAAPPAKGVVVGR